MPIGIPEILLIAVIALIIFGPKRLPDMGRSFGQALREFKKGAESVANEVKSAVDVEDMTKELSEATKIVTDPLGEEKKEPEAVPVAEKAAEKTGKTT